MTIGRSKSDVSKKLKVAKDYVTDGMKVDTHSSFGDNIKELFSRIKPKSASGKRNLAGFSVAEFDEFLKNKVGTAENRRDVADVLELLTPDQYLLEDIRDFRNTGSNDANVWTPISFLNAVSKHFKIENYLEIGVRRGRSLCQILAHSMDVDVCAFDLWIKNYAGAENPGPEFVQSEMAKVGYKKKINFYNGDSGKLLPKFFRDLDSPYYFDVIYVDGDHSYEGALNDLHNVIGHLKPGGILLFDDVNHPQHKYLAKVWDTIKAENPNLAYYESDYGYGLRIGLNKGDLCSDSKPYINAKHRENVAGTGASVSGTTKKVLIVRPDAIGDFVIFSGVLGYFRKLYPNAHISIVVQKNVAELAQSCPHVDEVIVIDRKSAETDRNYLNVLIERLRAGKFDLAINPVYSRTALDDFLVLNSGALEKIAFIGDDSNMDMGQKRLNDANYDRLVPATEGLLLETKRNDEFIKGLGAAMESPCKPTIWLNQQDKDYIDGLLNELGPGIKEPVVICPFAQAAYRQWPTHKWAQLLSHYKDLPVLICGADKDRNEADLLIDLAGHSNIHNICGKTNLKQLAALFSKSRLCVASESGTAHIAAAMDCPQVVIIGGGHFGRFMPYSPTTSLVYLPMDCYNCNWKCPFWRWEIYCISQVSVAKVNEAVREALTNPNPSDGQPRFFKDDIKLNSSINLTPAPTLHIAESTQNDTNKPTARCWCGGEIGDSVHTLYGMCRDCATLVLKKKPAKKQLQKLYSMDGYWHEQMDVNGYPQIEQRAISDFADRIPVWFETLIKHKAKPENLLEIGCAHGGFLHYCRQRGVNNVVGVEVDQGVCKFARDYFNLPHIACGLFPDVELPFDKFDVIVGFDVFEHFADPIEALKKIKDLLGDDGICLFQIPCYRGEGAEWAQFRPSEHIYLHNNESVRRLFEAGGFEIDEITPGYYADDIFVVASHKMAAKDAALAGSKDTIKNTTDVLVTAIVSTYNSEDCIAHCLQDLEEQSIADKLEIIVVDSGSSQNEGAIVRTFQQKYKNIKYVRTKSRETINKAWNRAIRMASGKYITNANTDDSHRADALEVLAKALDERPDAVLAYADQGCVEKVDGKPVKDFIAGEYSRYRMLAEWCYISSHPMWRKEAHKEFGYFDEMFVAGGDWEFWLRISQKYDFVYINENLGNRRWTEECLSRKSFTEGIMTYEAELFRKCYHYALETGMVVDYRGISANPVFASWPEVSWWKQKVHDKLSEGVFDPNSNIKSVYDYRKGPAPRLSIVIVADNNLPGLRATIECLNEQTENSFEVIVVNSGQIIQESQRIAGQLKYGLCFVELKLNLGPAYAKNIGIKQAKGEYIAFLDDETVAQKDFAKLILEHFGNPEIYGLRGRVLPKDEIKKRHIPPEYDLGEGVVFTACEVGTNCAFRKDMLDRVGGFNENLFGYEFQELSYRIFRLSEERIDCILYFSDVVAYRNPPAEYLSYYTNQLQRRIGRKLAEYKWPGVESYIELARNQYSHRRGQFEKDYTQLLNIALLLQIRHPEQALKWAEKAAALNPDGVASGYALGSLYLRLEKYNEARVILEKILGPLETSLVNGYSQMPNVKSNILTQIAYYFVSTCTGLAQCYMKQSRYDKVKQVYTAILNKPYLLLPPAKKAGILNVLRKLEKTSPALVVTEKENNTAAPAARIKNDFLVSAIVSTYNSEKFLRGCLNDLENQTIADKLEIIVINSGSEEEEESIVREFQKKHGNIVYIRTEKREGLYNAWNRAVKAASGLFLTSANTDDRHRRDALEVMAKALIANPDIGLVYGDQVVTDTPNPTLENHHVVEMAKRAEFSKQRLLFGCCVGSQPMWRKSLHDEFGGFDETLTCAADWDFWLKVAGKYSFRHIPEFLGLYYHNEEGIEHGQKIHSLYERYAVGKRYGNPYISVVPLYQAPDNPLVSVVIAAYNAENYIARAIESVLIQNYRNFELIVVDDGSTDKTPDIVSNFKNEPIKYFFKENGGVASARNFGVQKTGGTFVIMLDSDDMMTTDYIARHLQVLHQNPDADMIYCDELLINEQDKPLRLIKRPEYSDQNTFISDLFRCGFPVVHFKTFIKRSVFDKIGPYDERLIIAEDYDMIRRFVKHNLKMIHLPVALYLRRLTERSLSRSFNAKKAKSHFDVVSRFTKTFTPEQLFPDVRWDELPAEQRSVLAKCRTAFVYLGIGQQYVASAPDYAATAFEMANAEMDDCCKIEPANQQVRDLREKCRSICTGRLSSSRQSVCQPV